MNSVSVHCLFAFIVLLSASHLKASAKLEAAKETAEYVLETFGERTGKETLESLTTEIESLAVKYGDDALTAVRKVGPNALEIAEEAGPNEAQAIKLMARYGESGASIAAKHQSMAMFMEYGDEAAAVMAEHPGITESLIDSQGEPAVRAFSQLNGQNARRLAIMESEGDLKALGHTDELLKTIAQYGNGAMDFVWNNKGALTVGTTLTAFLANPKPFIEGAVKPAVEGLREITKQINWTLIVLVLFVTAACIKTLRTIRDRNRLDSM